MIIPNEIDLLAGAQSFDLHSLAEIYDTYSPGLYGYAMRLLGDDCLAEDCVSETFSRFLKALRAGKGPQDHLQAYLYRISHNWITDRYRREPPPPFKLVEDVPAGDNLRPEAQVELRMEQDKVRSALRQLTPDQRQVVMLRFVEDWETQAVSAALEKPIGAIKALQHRALETLRMILLAENNNRPKDGMYEPE
ncbi:MAG: sigma-70 family RNA polymerase sigma factor [Methanothrix sp.]|nr:sigma-70 family RNA polymerase sigma factor [Methanothrix sp.]